MVDNVAITAGTGTSIATDDVGGVHYQQVKVVWGPTDTANVADVATGKPLPIQIRSSTGTEATFNTNGQATAANSSPVVLASDVTVSTNPQPGATGGLSLFRSLDLDETEEDVKTSPGCLYKLRITNFATSARYVKLYNDTAANVSVGSTTPLDTIPVPGSSSGPVILTESFGGIGLTFSVALSAAATTALADADTGAPAANDVVVSAYYK